MSSDVLSICRRQKISRKLLNGKGKEIVERTGTYPKTEEPDGFNYKLLNAKANLLPKGNVNIVQRNLQIA